MNHGDIKRDKFKTAGDKPLEQKNKVTETKKKIKKSTRVVEHDEYDKYYEQ
jgi:hypothetical protein